MRITSIVKIILILCCSTMVAAQSAGCSDARHADNSSIGVTRPIDNPLVLHYSALKGRFTGWDPNSGRAVFAPPKGVTTSVDATVLDVNLRNRSPSMSLENDIAYFQVDPHQHIAGYPDGQRIELLFDQYGLYGPKPFEKADRWRLVLTADNQLASIELLSPTDVDRSHPKIRALIEAMQTIRSRDAGDAKNQHFAFFASIAPTGMNVTFAASNGPSLSHSLVR